MLMPLRCYTLMFSPPCFRCYTHAVAAIMLLPPCRCRHFMLRYYAACCFSPLPPHAADAAIADVASRFATLCLMPLPLRHVILMLLFRYAITRHDADIIDVSPAYASGRTHCSCHVSVTNGIRHHVVVIVHAMSVAATSPPRRAERATAITRVI